VAGGSEVVDLGPRPEAGIVWFSMVSIDSGMVQTVQVGMLQCTILYGFTEHIEPVNNVVEYHINLARHPRDGSIHGATFSNAAEPSQCTMHRCHYRRRRLYKT